MEHDKHIITNTIRVMCYNDYSRMRLFDYLFKHKCYPCGAGTIDNQSYLLFDCDEYLFYKDIFYSKRQEEYESLREF